LLLLLLLLLLVGWVGAKKRVTEMELRSLRAMQEDKVRNQMGPSGSRFFCLSDCARLGLLSTWAFSWELLHCMLASGTHQGASFGVHMLGG